MDSSTSSSSRATRNWLWTWLLTIALSLVALVSYESRLADLGFRPSVDMDEDLWSWHRMQVTCCSTEPLVLLGASRLLLGISMEELQRALPQFDVTLLGLNGRYPLAALEDLAADERFSGTVIVSLTAQALEPRYWDMQKPYVDYYRESSSLYRSFDAWLRSQVQAHLAFANADISLRQLVQFYDEHGVFKVPLHTTRAADLSIRADFDQVDVEQSRRYFIEDKRRNYEEFPPSPPKQWALQIERLNQQVKRIQERGGQVILLRLPTSGGHWELDESYYPRSEYWAQLERGSLARTVHFRDLPGMAEFELPDTSHLDYRDRDRFTSELIRHLFPHRAQSALPGQLPTLFLAEILEP